MSAKAAAWTLALENAELQRELRAARKQLQQIELRLARHEIRHCCYCGALTEGHVCWAHSDLIALEQGAG